MAILKKILLFLFIFILLLIGGGLTLAYIYEDEIGARAVKELSKNLQTDLRVKKVELSVFSDFPEASVLLKGIELEDTDKKELLTAERLSFRFGIWSLFGDNIEVHSVGVENGTLNIRLDKRGRGNYDILKPSESPAEPTEAGGNFTLQLDEAELSDIVLRYQDDRSRQKIKTTVKDGKVSGNFSDTKFALNSESELFLHYINAAGEQYLEKRDIYYKAKIDVDLAAGTYDFERVELTVNGTEFIADGHLAQERDYLKTDILLTSDDASLTAVIQLLPEEYSDYFKDFSSRGKFNFELWVQGNYGEKELPGIEAKFGLTNGQIRSKKLHDPLENVSFAAKFTNGQYRNNKTSVFEINNFTGRFAGKPVTADLMIFDFDDPKVDFKMNGTLPMSSVYDLIDSPSVTDGSGEIRVKDLIIEGRYADMQNMYAIKKVKAKGTAEFEDAGLEINGEMIAVEEGEITLDGNKLSAVGIEMTGAETIVTFDGTFRNLLPVLFADTKNSKKAELEFDAALTAKKLDIGKLIALTQERQVPAAYSDETQRLAFNDSLQTKAVLQRERFTSLLKGNFTARADEFIYGEINGKNFVGKLGFNNNEMTINGRTDAMDGIFDLDGVMVFAARPYLKAKLICNQVNIKEFFRQSENFGQEVLTHKNLDGKINSKILIQAYFDEQNNFLEDKLIVLAGIGVNDGYLRNLEMLEAFSDYVKIEDLRNIKFTDLKNWFEIRKGRIYIPAMFIQSNALNLELAGEYTFTHDMDFNIKVNAGQILVNSFKKHNRRLDPQPAKRRGFFNLYYKVHGNIDDYDYEMNRKEVKADMARSEYRRRDIRVRLRKEFGNLNLFEEPKDWQDEGESERVSEPETNTVFSTEKPEYIEGF